jgi:hypothetical protein
MEIWASVYPKDVDKKADLVVLRDDGCRDCYGLVVWDGSVLFLNCLPF